MPWKSDKQRRWGNSPAGHKALGDKAVAEFNQASKGMHLPETRHSVGQKGTEHVADVQDQHHRIKR